MIFKKKAPKAESNKEFKARRLKELRGSRGEEEFSQSIQMSVALLKAYESASYELRRITLEFIADIEEIHLDYFYDTNSTLEQMKAKYLEQQENIRLQEQKDKEFILSCVDLEKYSDKKRELLSELSELIYKMGTHHFCINDMKLFANLAEDVGESILLGMIKNRGILIEQHEQRANEDRDKAPGNQRLCN
ncbi:MAG: hypothetical protein N3B21_06575 [Clostridia bacterium]|nr:hypothetical protein [Clostridia bacterium]